ncbi:MAG: type II secretion system F family protein [Pseudomonadota bacterium]
MTMSEILVYAALFIGVMLMGQSVYLLLFDRQGKREARISERFERMNREALRESEVMALRRQRRSRPKGWEAVPLFGGVVRKATAASVKIHPFTLLIFMLALGALIFVLLLVLFGVPAPFAAAGGATASFAGVRYWLSRKLEARREAFEEQLPDALEMIARSLKLGNSFNSGVAMVAREAPEPTCSEFKTVINEVDYGVSMPVALDRMAERLDSQNLRFLTVAVSIQSQGGGSLAEVLLNLSSMVRARFRMFHKVRAITSEGRLSGWLLSIFPIFVIFGAQAVRPDYFETVLKMPQFPIVAFITFLLLVMNIFFMRIVVNIKV